MQTGLWTPDCGLPPGARANAWLREERLRQREGMRHIRDPRVERQLEFASPSFVSMTHLGANSVASPATINAPATISNGNILQLHLYFEAAQNVRPVTPPAGFSLLGFGQAANGANIFCHYVWWKRAASESGNYSMTWSPTTATFRDAVMLNFSGAIATGFPYEDSTNMAVTQPIATVTPPASIVTTAADTLLIVTSTAWQTLATWGVAGGGLTWTERFDSGTDDISSATAPMATPGLITVTPTGTMAVNSDPATTFLCALLSVAPPAGRIRQVLGAYGPPYPSVTP